MFIEENNFAITIKCTSCCHITDLKRNLLSKDVADLKIIIHRLWVTMKNM